MSVIWYKLWSDLWDNKIRTLLIVLSIAVGLFAVGLTFGMADQMLASMDAAHQAGIPAHFTMYVTQNIDRDIVHRLKKVKGVEDIALGSQKTIRYKIRPDDEWDTAWLIMREDYTDQQYELLSLKAGQWPRGNRIGIERLSSQDFNLDIGHTLFFEVDDRPRLRKINGILRHSFVGPPSLGGPTVFFTDAEGMALFDLPRGEYNQILVRVTPYSQALVREVASEIKDRLSKENVGVAITMYQDPQKHWGRPIMAGINMVLEMMAVVSLAASLVLVFNTMMAVVTQQTHQIGILKAIGGTQGKIIKLYLAAVLVYGLLSLLISLPLAALLAYGISKYFLNIFNIDYEQFQYSTLALGLQVIAALAVPVLAALWPILNGTAITVRQAIATYGLGGDFGSSRLDRLVEQLGRRFLSAPYAVALGNMFRRKGRLWLTQGVLVLAGVMFLAVMSLSSSINLTLDNIFTRQNYDFVLTFDDNERIERVVAIAENHPGVAYAEVWFSHGASILKAGQHLKEAGLGAELIGLPNGTGLFRPDLIVGGRWLSPLDGPAIVISQDNAGNNNIQVGHTVTLDLGELGHAEWQVVGIYQSTLSDLGGEIDPIYANLEAVFKATHRHNQGTQIYVQTRFHNETYVQAVARQLETMYEAKNIDVAAAQTLSQHRSEVDSQLGLVVTMLSLLAVIMALVGGIGLMGALSISVVERTREIGVMRAIGARTPAILGMFIMEGVLQGLFSWFIGVPLSFVLGRSLADALGTVLFDATLDYRYNLGAVLTWFVIVLVISALASVLPAHNATTISVRDSLAYA